MFVGARATPLHLAETNKHCHRKLFISFDVKIKLKRISEMKRKNKKQKKKLENSYFRRI